MAFDPMQEDCHRLVLETMRRNKVALNDSDYVGHIMEAFQNDSDELIVTDRDRAFHLVAQVAASVDYQIPFIADDAQAETEADRAEDMIAEAVRLDPNNLDAQRMQAALASDSNEEYVAYMEERLGEVQTSTTLVMQNTQTAYDREFAADLAKRPYLRWMNALAARQLISGRYRRALNLAEQSLAADPTDPGDVRYTALLAASKLEYSALELRRFRTRHQLAFRSAPVPRHKRYCKNIVCDAWSLIAEMNAHYRAFEYDEATETLRTIKRYYPHAAEAFYFQAEFPDGIYARVNVVPGTTDELVLAISEATPLLQEGFGNPDSADFALWVRNHELVQGSLDRQLIKSLQAEQERRWGEQ